MQMTKIRVHIDPKGYDEKPSGKEIGGIKSRLQKGTSPSLVTLEEHRNRPFRQPRNHGGHERKELEGTTTVYGRY